MCLLTADIVVDWTNIIGPVTLITLFVFILVGFLRSIIYVRVITRRKQWLKRVQPITYMGFIRKVMSASRFAL